VNNSQHIVKGRQNRQHADKGFMGFITFVTKKVKTGAGVLVP